MAVDAATTFIASWFTPSSLFIIVNLVIGTIAITSRLTSSSAPPKKQINHEPPQLARSPSLLNRLSSFNLSFYQHHPIPAETHYAPPDSTQIQLNVPKPSLLERVRSFTRSETHEYSQPQPEPENMSTDPKVPQLVRTPSLLERVRSMNFSRLYRSDSLHRDEEEDPNPTGFNVSGKVEMKKSASERGMMCESSSEEDEETVERRRPATVSASTYREEDEEVDTKADDFINRFKKQLRLQRLDSLLRYRDNNAIRGN